jgi:hypothetical protein
LFLKTENCTIYFVNKLKQIKIMTFNINGFYEDLSKKTLIEVEQPSELDQVNQKVTEVASQPEKFTCQIRHWQFLQKMAPNSVLHYVEEATGIPFWIGERVEAWRRYFQGEVDVSREPFDPHTCGYTGRALLSQGFFNQHHVKTIASLEELVKGLQDDQPGVFQLHTRYFDHVFILIKTIENGQQKYRIFQSYIGIYSLNDFIQKSGIKFVYENYNDLEKRFIDPLVSLVSTQGALGMHELAVLSELTFVDIGLLSEWARRQNKLGQVISTGEAELNMIRTTLRKQERVSPAKL